MTEQLPIALRRARLRESFFPDGVPVLWCPPVTHYDRDGAIDRARIQAHLRHLSPWAKGLLVPGSTGDGWELSAEEAKAVLGIVLEEARKSKLRVLIGALRTNAKETQSDIRDISAWLQSVIAPAPAASSNLPSPVCGFTVCAPRGAGLSQEEIEAALAAILAEDQPIALYQLPQVTQNEFSGDVASRLALRFENFLLFKDSSGADRVATSGKCLEGVFTLRGAEGDYSRWLTTASGPYDGFLLGSANCFAAQLHQMIQELATGRLGAARAISDRLTGVVGEVTGLVQSLPFGNAFANANKAIDHFYAWGPSAGALPPPRLHQGSQLPAETVRAAGESLSRHGLMPKKGYLE